MRTRPVVVACGVAAVVMALLDAGWITLVASDLYRSELGAMVADSPRWLPALGFYLLFWVGLCWFVVTPALRRGDGFSRVVLDAALLGLVAYGTWALTGLAVLTEMTWTVAVSDLLWGPVMSVAVAVTAVWAGRRSARRAGDGQ
jgi:uncharacterized membrane protein